MTILENVAPPGRIGLTLISRSLLTAAQAVRFVSKQKARLNTESTEGRTEGTDVGSAWCAGQIGEHGSGIAVTSCRPGFSHRRPRADNERSAPYRSSDRPASHATATGGLEGSPSNVRALRAALLGLRVKACFRRRGLAYREGGPPIPGTRAGRTAFSWAGVQEAVTIPVAWAVANGVRDKSGALCQCGQAGPLAPRLRGGRLSQGQA